jgi:hypothetical protein
LLADLFSVNEVPLELIATLPKEKFSIKKGDEKRIGPELFPKDK